MIDVEAIKWKAGKDWSSDELEAVFGEQYKPGKLERWVGLAKAYTQDDETAKDAVQEALIKTAANINDYEPNKYHGKKCPFDNWLGQRVIWQAKMASRNAKQQRLPPHVGVDLSITKGHCEWYSRATRSY